MMRSLRGFLGLKEKQRDSNLPLKIRYYSSNFKKNRHEYYEYLSMIMVESMGKKTILDIFRDDARRYGKGNPRGELSAFWASRIEQSGDLAQAFEGTLPEEDVGFIYSLQAAGGGILESGLKDLSHLIQVKNRLSGILQKFTAVTLFAFSLFVGMLFAVGYFLAPEIQGSFNTIPPEFYKGGSRLFFGIGEFMRSSGHFYVGGALILLFMTPFILKNATGKARSYLDKYGVFALYRNVQSIRFLLSLSTLIKPHAGAESISLTHAVHLLSENESRWMRWHLGKMQQRMEQADIGAETFDTGLFDKEVIWYLTDMASVSGLDEALQRSKTRLELHTVTALESKTKILSWIILLSLVFSMLGIYMLVLKVMMEMTGLMKLGVF